MSIKAWCSFIERSAEAGKNGEPAGAQNPMLPSPGGWHNPSGEHAIAVESKAA